MTRKQPDRDRIEQYIASQVARLEKATGRSIAQWIRIARTCPPGTVPERLRWFRTQHGLGPARAALVLGRALGPSALLERPPADPLARLFAGRYEAQRVTYDAVTAFVRRLGPGTVKPGKGYVSLYRLKHYAALKPGRAGLVLGLALAKYPRDGALVEVKRFGGNPRIRRALVLANARGFNTAAKALLRQAYSEA